MQVKLLLSGNSFEKPEGFFTKSDQDDPTLYISALPQFAEDFKAKKRGLVFCGSNFCVGLLGDPSAVRDFEELKTEVSKLSSKATKVMSKDKVSFKFKEKSKKAVNTTGVQLFMISGADMNTDMLGELLSA